MILISVQIAVSSIYKRGRTRQTILAYQKSIAVVPECCAQAVAQVIEERSLHTIVGTCNDSRIQSCTPDTVRPSHHKRANSWIAGRLGSEERGPLQVGCCLNTEVCLIYNVQLHSTVHVLMPVK